MTWLYTDTTDHMIFGLLSDDYKWIEYHDIPSKKSSSKIHFLVNEMLERHHVDIKNNKGYIFAAGPGSYTGMRVSEGIAQIFEWQKIKVYSFYHFNVPELVENFSGIWCSEAFKGEYFVYDLENKSRHLYQESEFINLLSLNKDGCFTHFMNDKIKNISGDQIGFELTGEVIKNSPQKIFPSIISASLRVKPLYYRAEDKEFTKGKR